ncbi:MAG: hypothetical protein DU429_03475 [Candidatus Tokpelaia sp.]|nr:MAG: hypothetical protein DU430_01340 [Candidatus Tokpelaia sp.]KAA6207170.1 MAG: hypothetical protein DU429_03475 [Candidatus Tokpelaia sp.]
MLPPRPVCAFNEAEKLSGIAGNFETEKNKRQTKPVKPAWKSPRLFQEQNLSSKKYKVKSTV